MTAYLTAWSTRIGLAAMLAMAMAMAPPSRAATLSCTEAAEVAEAGAGIPAGVLLAIGLVESGRVDASGARVPWPLSIQSGGTDRYLRSADAAIAAVLSLRAGGVQSIDIGCFQINLFHHPDAFPDLASGFDPLTNALAAARFLVSLHDEFGAWEPAIAAYHSRVDTLGAPYRDKVMASWRGRPASVEAERVVADIRIWGPAGKIGGTFPSPAATGALPGAWISMPRILMAAR